MVTRGVKNNVKIGQNKNLGGIYGGGGVCWQKPAVDSKQSEPLTFYNAASFWIKLSARLSGNSAGCPLPRSRFSSNAPPPPFITKMLLETVRGKHCRREGVWAVIPFRDHASHQKPRPPPLHRPHASRNHSRQTGRREDVRVTDK